MLLLGLMPIGDHIIKYVPNGVVLDVFVVDDGDEEIAIMDIVDEG